MPPAASAAMNDDDALEQPEEGFYFQADLGAEGDCGKNPALLAQLDAEAAREFGEGVVDGEDLMLAWRERAPTPLGRWAAMRQFYNALYRGGAEAALGRQDPLLTERRAAAFAELFEEDLREAPYAERVEHGMFEEQSVGNSAYVFFIDPVAAHSATAAQWAEIAEHAAGDQQPRVLAGAAHAARVCRASAQLARAVEAGLNAAMEAMAAAGPASWRVSF